MSLGEGQVFAGYRIVRRLGAGGMGEVYLAQHPRLPRQDALKLLTGGVTADPNFRKRFLREADLASTLWHPHIVGVHDRGEHEGQLWISMDFVDGEDAASLLRRKYPTGMPKELVSAIITAVASALDHAHKKGLLHRDVKPANIVLTHVDDAGDQRILLTDFGIARTVDDSSGLTETNMTVGTVDYTAPEQLTGGHLDGRSDQYALAATAYHLLTGAPPYRDSNPAVVIGRHLSQQPPSLAAVKPELAPLDGVLAAGLAKDPDNRFATCGDFARAFAEQASGKAGPYAHAAPTTPGPQQTRKADQSAGPTILAPGWYPDPSCRGGKLYWDGQGWHAAPSPKTVRPTPASPTRSANRAGIALVAASCALAAVLIIGAVVLVSTRDSSPSDTAASQLPVSTTAPTSLTSSPVEEPEPSPAPEPEPSPRSWTAAIVGTCDEGGSCGLKQRTAPYTDAPRLYPNDLRDGMTVSIACQTVGDGRSSAGHGTSYIWYKLTNGAYINLVYTTLKSPSGMPSC